MLFPKKNFLFLVNGYLWGFIAFTPRYPIAALLQLHKGTWGGGGSGFRGLASEGLFIAHRENLLGFGNL